MIEKEADPGVLGGIEVKDAGGEPTVAAVYEATPISKLNPVVRLDGTEYALVVLDHLAACQKCVS